MRLNKTPRDGACLGELPGGFCDVGCCCCFSHWRFLRFRTTFLCHWHSTLASQAREGFHELWALPWLLSVALLLPGFSFLPQALRFRAGIFYSQAFFTLHIFPRFLIHFVTQVRAGTPHPGSSSVPAFTVFSLPYLNKYSSKLKSSHPVCLLKGSQT